MAARKARSKGYMEDARKAFAALPPRERERLVDAIRLALRDQGPRTLGPILLSCQTSLSTTGRDGRRHVPETVTGEAVAGALYALAVDGRVSVRCKDDDYWAWRRD